jgi:prepilin-type N-terminal cleavage/methylation domain-containing protein/prepilin-type processing-associated H-X9-DG protein
MRHRHTNLRFSRDARRGWTAVELLVVTAIIAVLAALLLPTVGRARQESKRVRCQAQLRDLGQALHAYAGENGGWLYPVDRDPVTGQPRTQFGINHPPHGRWPAIVFKLTSAVAPLPYDPASYTMDPYDPATFPAAPFTPASMLCPSDEEPKEAHTYVVNGHLGRRGFRLGDKDLGGRATHEVILAGEKRSVERDYYLQDHDFDRVAEPFRHGELRGSNYLFLDSHVETQQTREIKGGVDPWDVVR